MSQSPYHTLLYEHYRNPRYKGTLAQCTFESGTYNPSCGDVVLFQGIVVDNQLMQVAFDGKGCVISMATASLLSEHVLTKSLEEIAALGTQDILTLIGMPLGPTRLRCALLPLEALQKGLKNA